VDFHLTSQIQICHESSPEEPGLHGDGEGGFCEDNLEDERKDRGKTITGLAQQAICHESSPEEPGFHGDGEGGFCEDNLEDERKDREKTIIGLAQ
jgi:hypothetical protein